MAENETQYNDEISDNDHFDEQDLRVVNILAPGREKELDDVPDVDKETLQSYYVFLKKNLTEGLLLTGSESMGYFSWEERFEWGDSSESEYSQLREKNASYQDTYKFVALTQKLSEVKVLAEVIRLSDNKHFHIPLEDLVVFDDDKNFEAAQLFGDFSYWYENHSY